MDLGRKAIRDGRQERNMRWWSHLYMGKKASDNRAKVLNGIREGRFMPDTYVITLPKSGNHILDICPVLLSAKEEKKQHEDIMILGVASGYSEAKEVVRDMVDDMYRQTGAFDWDQYMKWMEKSGADETV